MKDLELLFSRENEECKPLSKRSGDAGFDLYVDPVWFREEHQGWLSIPPLSTAILSTGIRTVFSEKYYAQFQERGSTGIKGMKYGSGVIDSNYRGIWNVVITNCNEKILYITDFVEKVYEKGDCIVYPVSKAIAQVMFLEVPKMDIRECGANEVLAFESERGEGKFDSTKK